MYNIHYSYRILSNVNFVYCFFAIFSNVEFHENPSNGNRVVPRGQRDIQTDRQTDGITDRRSDITVMISPLPTRRNGLLGADLTCET